MASIGSMSRDTDADALRTRSRRRSFAAFAAAFLIGISVCLGLAGAALYVWDAGYEGRVLAGVQVGGVDLSGLDREEASAKLLAAFGDHEEGAVTVPTAAGDVTVPYADFRRPDVAGMVDAALAAGRTGSPPERALGEIRLAMSGQTIEPRRTVDDSAFAAAVERAVAQIPTPSLDPGVTTDDADTPVTPSESGRTLDAATRGRRDTGRRDSGRRDSGSHSARNTSACRRGSRDQSCDRSDDQRRRRDVRQVEMDDQGIRRAVMGAP